MIMADCVDGGVSDVRLRQGLSHTATNTLPGGARRALVQLQDSARRPFQPRTLSSRPESQQCFSVGMEWRDLVVRKLAPGKSKAITTGCLRALTPPAFQSLVRRTGSLSRHDRLSPTSGLRLAAGLYHRALLPRKAGTGSVLVIPPRLRLGFKSDVGRYIMINYQCLREKLPDIWFPAC